MKTGTCEVHTMIFDSLSLSQGDVRALLGAANADAALLYIYIKSGNQPSAAAEDLHMSPSRISARFSGRRHWSSARWSRFS